MKDVFAKGAIVLFIIAAFTCFMLSIWSNRCPPPGVFELTFGPCETAGKLFFTSIGFVLGAVGIKVYSS